MTVAQKRLRMEYQDHMGRQKGLTTRARNRSEIAAHCERFGIDPDKITFFSFDGKEYPRSTIAPVLKQYLNI